MPPLTSIERDDLLATPGLLLRIATVDAAGNPQVTPIWFIYEDGRIWFTPRSESAWLEHIRTHPRIGAVIDETEIPYRKLVFEGDAEIVYDLGADDVWRDRYRRIAERYRKVADLPVWAKPNAGLPELEGTNVVYRDTPEEMAALLPQALDAGVSIFGGCCGATPAHVQAFRAVIDDWNRR